MTILNGITPGIYEILETSGNTDIGSAGQQYNPLPSDITEVGLYRDSGTTAATQVAANLTWGGIIKESTARINTVLEERSYLDFYFPNENIGRRRVLFFENPKITEQRSPRYAKKNIVGRNEPARLWTGSDARKVKITFTYTLPHVEMFFKMMGSLPAGFANAEQITSQADTLNGTEPVLSTLNDWRTFTAMTVDTFFGTSFETNTAGGTLSIKNPSQKGPRMYTDSREVDGFGVNTTPKANFMQGLINAWSTDAEPLSNSNAVATFYTQFVIDTLRASVIGDTINSGSTPVGPPIVRFRHGTLFNEAPFIITSMNVDYTTESGVEVRTLLPRQVKFTLSLEEFRQTHGAQHGDGKEAVQNASNLIDLRTGYGSLNVDRERFPKHSF